MRSSFKPKKSLGQNFLKNPRIIEKIIDVAEIKSTDTVVEVGPGLGALTGSLLKKAGHVIAIEKDTALFEILKKKFVSEKKLELVLGDALEIPPPARPYLLVANIPYYITSPLLDYFVRQQPDNLPVRAVILVQKEVAEKMCAKPPHMNVLALHVQTFGMPRIVINVSKNNFQPAPKVDSAVVKIEFEDLAPSTLHQKADYEKYFSLIHRAFGHKRKMLRATLPQELLQSADIDPRRRPETLSIEEWWRVAYS